MKIDNQKLENLRQEYAQRTLDIKDTSADPVEQFNSWFSEAMGCECEEPNAFTLSTIKKNKPRSRVLLLKGILPQGFIFYTNYDSDKGQELSQTPFVAMNFLWLALHRQVRIEGEVIKTDKKLSDEYFQKRPKDSQLGAIASPQSRKLKNREELEKYFMEAEKKYSNGKINRPEHWGGYIVKPNFFEFWQGRKNRLHDRISYVKKNSVWERARLAP